MNSETSSESPDDKPIIRYLNSDLDLVCDVDLSLIIECFDTFDMYSHLIEGGDGLWSAMCEDMNGTTPESNIVKLLDAIEALTGPARDLWGRCSKREFNVGYDCGENPGRSTKGFPMMFCGVWLTVEQHFGSPCIPTGPTPKVMIPQVAD